MEPQQQMQSALEAAPQKFHSPEQELAFLRHQVQQLEARMGHVQPGQSVEQQRQELAHQLVDAYHATPGIQVMGEEHIMPQQEAEEISLNLEPEEHDSVIEQLYAVMLERGVKNAMSVVDQMHSPHLEDDFHRFLVQYLLSAGELPGLKNSNELYKALNVTLFKVSLPRPEEDEKRTFKEFIAMMEQFYAGMQSVATGVNKDQDYYTLEVALEAGSDQVVFYAGIPNDKLALFEKQVLGLFPNARLEPVPNDYNIFGEEVFPVAAYATSAREEILPLRTYDQFELDPIDVLLNVFSKLETHSEGAAVQFVITPAGDRYIKEWGAMLERIQKGESLKTVWHGESLMNVAKGLFSSKSSEEVKADEDRKRAEQQQLNQRPIELIGNKLSSSILEVNIRCIAAAQTDVRSRQILRDIASAFNQFSEPQGNELLFEEVKPRRLDAFLKDYSFRMPDRSSFLRLNLRELASLYHFPAMATDAPQLLQAQSATGSAPLDMPREGIKLGINIHRGVETDIFINPQDRLRHFYVIGQTGTGKSGTLLSMIHQDIYNGDGCCFIDPHGSDVQTILSWIPEHRLDDVIYFDPAYMPRPMGLNMLEYDPNYPEQKTLIIDELMGIFNQLFDMKAQGGAMFQQYFKNSAFLVMDHPESGNTLLEITRVLGDKSFRDMKMQHCKNPIVRQFWVNAEQTTGDQSLANFVPYISSKFDPLVSNDILRPVIAQEHSAFNVRELMDNRKILLVNLSKGRLGEINANLIGLILVGKIQMAALSRADSHGAEFPPFYLYMDEFQNITTPAISSILSEARKYKLSLNMAHQFLAQLDDDIKNAVLGNVGNMQIFRISSEDAKALEPRVAPTFTAEDIMKQENRNAYMSMLVNGQPVPAFNMRTLDWPERKPEIVEPIKEMSYLKYGRPRDEVEAEIMGKYAQQAGE